MKLFSLWAALIFCGLCGSNVTLAEAIPESNYRAEAGRGVAPADFETTWQTLLIAAVNLDLRQVNEMALELDRLKVIHRLENLDLYALKLIELGYDAYRTRKDREAASVYFRRALQLSPESPHVLIALASGSEIARVGSPYRLAFKALRCTLSRPEYLIPVLAQIWYAVLAILSAALFICYCIVFILRPHEIMRGIAWLLPAWLRSVFGPVLVVFLVVLPLFSGPLWSFVVWGILVTVTLTEKNWLPFYSGVVVALWAISIPLRENMLIFSKDPLRQRILSLYNQPNRPDDLANLEKVAHFHADDPFIRGMAGRVAIRNRNFDRAEKLIAQARMLKPHSEWLERLEAEALFASGKYEAADKIYSKLERAGRKDAHFLFNHSKIKFELLDTETARNYLQQAQMQDSKLIQYLETREDMAEAAGVKALAESPAPLSWYLSSAVQPMPRGNIRQDALSGALMIGLNPPRMGMVGIFLIVLFLLVPKMPSLRQGVNYYRKFSPSKLIVWLVRFMPGGVLLERKWAARFFGVLAGLGILALPIMPVWELLPGLGMPESIKSVYTVALGISALTVSLVGMLFVEAPEVTNLTGDRDEP